jgi:hypothetical protein
MMVHFEITEKIKVFGHFLFLGWNHLLQPFPLRPRSGIMQSVTPVSSFPDRLRAAERAG